MNKARCVVTLALCATCGAACSSFGQLKINEVYYNVSPQGGNQFVELYNSALTNVYLDGMILTDEAGSGNEGVYKFPGSPGQTNHPVTPGQFVLVAVDATNATIGADWECYSGGADMDNTSVSNLTLVSGTNDFSLNVLGDNVVIANGTDTTAPISTSTIIDGMNFAGGGGELAQLSSSATDTNPNPAASTGESLSRCSDGNDTDVSSSSDFVPRVLTAGLPNACGGPGIRVSDATVIEGGTGTTINASFTVSLSSTNDTTVTVNYMTSNGTATATSDYTAVANTLLTFTPGTTAQTVQVTVFGDANLESNEVFYVLLLTPTNGALSDAQGVGSITDDDTVHLFLSVGLSGGTVTATWSTVAGLVYLPQYTTNLNTASWSDLGGAITASSSSATLIDTGVAHRIYRVLQIY